MKKILKSLAVVVIVGAIAGGATYSFFSDEEKSVGNTFTAGAIDLKVDSEAHYNGMVCMDNGGGKTTWQDANRCVEVNENLIKNGDFEEQAVTHAKKWDIFPGAGNPSISEWTIAWNSSETSFGGFDRPPTAQGELHKGVNGWTSAHGLQHMELDSDWVGPDVNLNNEPAVVKIAQGISTEIGKKYVLKFWYSPRPSTGQSENHLSVGIDGYPVKNVNLPGGSNVDWKQYEHEFVASGATTDIEFAEIGTSNSLGSFLDMIEVYELKCESVTTPEFIDEPCDGTWTLTDLGPTNKFFNFSDIKPGDRGENTISYHVYDNDAYACLMIYNVKNEEHDLIDPEQEANDETADEGELAQNLHFFAWQDDGDNIWEVGEQPLFSPQIGDGETLLDGKVYPLNLPGNPLKASETKYIGLSWCAGAMTVDSSDYSLSCDASTMGNETQTDEFSADVSFYVEQARNNGNFVCPPIPSDNPR